MPQQLQGALLGWIGDKCTGTLGTVACKCKSNAEIGELRARFLEGLRSTQSLGTAQPSRPGMRSGSKQRRVGKNVLAGVPTGPKRQFL